MLPSIPRSSDRQSLCLMLSTFQCLSYQCLTFVYLSIPILIFNVVVYLLMSVLVSCRLHLFYFSFFFLLLLHYIVSLPPVCLTLRKHAVTNLRYVFVLYKELIRQKSLINRSFYINKECTTDQDKLYLVFFVWFSYIEHYQQKWLKCTQK